MKVLLCLILFILSTLVFAENNMDSGVIKLNNMEDKLARYDFVYNGIMENSMESIPLGNGDLGVNVWATDKAMYLLLSKTDTLSENYRLLKTGLVKLSLEPNSFSSKSNFHLSLYDATLTITNPESGLKIILYVDANYPAYRLKIDSKNKIGCKVELINYREKDVVVFNNDPTAYNMQGMPGKLIDSADIIFNLDNSIGAYHRNNTSCYEDTLKLQGLENFSKKDDPFLNLTFGYLVNSKDLTLSDKVLKTDTKKNKISIDIYSLTKKTDNIKTWISDIDKLKKENKVSYNSHKSYWHKKWNKTYIFAGGSKEAELFTKGYIYQRYMNISAGRGKYPIKFNGSIFTMETYPNTNDYDYRMWGAPYWIQNTRLVYWAMLYSGDFELMKSFFEMYKNMLPISEYRSKEYYGHSGAFIPETATLFGTYTNACYGVNRGNLSKEIVQNNYIRWHYEGVLEIAYMMLEYYKYTRDENFLEKTALPFTKAVLEYFVNHFEDNGKITIKPASSLETWQNCINDTPTIAGLKAICNSLLEINQLTDMASDINKKLIDIPLETKNGKKVIAPAETLINKNRENCETPELYAVFPFRLYGLDKKDLSIARNTYFERDIRDLKGWGQDSLDTALLGLTDETIRLLTNNFSDRNKACIFPAFWGPNFDFTPDQDNGCVGSIAFTQMLLQCDKDSIKVLPAWNGWDVEFKLPVYNNKYVKYKRENGVVKVNSIVK